MACGADRTNYKTVGTSNPVSAFPFSVGTVGANVSTAFRDGHAEGVDEAFACDIYQIQPDTP